MKNKSIYSLCILIVLSSSFVYASDFITVNGTQFYLNEKPFYFAGTNNYYLFYKPWPQVEEVLNDVKAMNLSVLRTWGFCSGPKKEGYGFQPEQGVYDEATLQRMDKIIKEAGNRGIKLMIPLENNWWFKDGTCLGMCQYVRWCNISNWESCNPEADAGTIGTFVHDQFFINNCTKTLYKNYVKYFLNRTNTLTGIKYKDDPTIFAWQLANEPRARSDPSGQTLYNWIDEMGSYVKSIDPNHLLTTGEDGFYLNKSNQYGYDGYDGQDFISHHQIPTIDFASMHMYPWSNYFTYENMLKWIEEHAIDANRILKKPVTLNEFGVMGGLRDEQMQGYYKKIEDVNLNGDIFWILCHDGYPDYDGYCVYYPGGSTVSIITNHANTMKNKNYTNNFPTIEPIENIRVNETDLIIITINATDEDNDELTYYIDNNRYTKNNNTFKWQTQEGDYGVYYTTVYVNDGGKINISTSFYVIVKEDKPCIIPTDGMIITENTSLCVDIYPLPNGIDSYKNGVAIDCRGSILVGNGTGIGIDVTFDEGKIKNCNVRNYEFGIYATEAKFNIISNNNLDYNKRYALYLNWYSNNNSIINNSLSFTNNYVGVQFWNSHNNTMEYNRISGHDKGIYNSGDENKLGYNNVYNNNVNVYIYGIENVSAEYNWWGTADRNEISYRIYDYHDNPSLGLVDFEPYLLGPYEGGEYLAEQIILIKGWNLVSIPLTLPNVPVSSIFDELIAIYAYNGPWFVPKNIDSKLGYWIKVDEDINVTIVGTEIENLTINLNDGWNLVGYPYLEEKNISEIFNNAIIYSYNGSWSSYIPNRTFNSLQILKPGYGYWVKK